VMVSPKYPSISMSAAAAGVTRRPGERTARMRTDTARMRKWIGNAGIIITCNKINC
jgi:hypothetical protein